MQTAIDPSFSKYGDSKIDCESAKSYVKPGDEDAASNNSGKSQGPDGNAPFDNDDTAITIGENTAKTAWTLFKRIKTLDRRAV